MKRSVSVAFPSLKPRLTLWVDTEDEETFDVRSFKRGKPYVLAYGVRYELTQEEISTIKAMQNALIGFGKID